jgi:hypothetical protein
VSRHAKQGQRIIWQSHRLIRSDVCAGRKITPVACEISWCWRMGHWNTETFPLIANEADRASCSVTGILNKRISSRFPFRFFATRLYFVAVMSRWLYISASYITSAIWTLHGLGENHWPSKINLSARISALLA